MRITLLFLLFASVIMSCDQEEEMQKEGNCLTAVINGEEFTAESTTGTFFIATIDYEGLGVQETRILTILGTIVDLSGSTESITLSFGCSEFTPELNIADIDSDCGMSMEYSNLSFSNPNGSIAIEAVDGTINIEELTEGRISGTFAFSGEGQDGQTYNVTNGFFDTTINE